jgi:cell division protein FtsB
MGTTARSRQPYPSRSRPRAPYEGSPRSDAGLGSCAALGLLLLALTMAYAYPLRVYLAQQAEIRQLESDQRAQREHIQQLVEQVARWNDEDYVVAQARARLQLVRAGERIYVVGVDRRPRVRPASRRSRSVGTNRSGRACRPRMIRPYAEVCLRRGNPWSLTIAR